MQEKLKIARGLRNSRKKGKNKEYKKLCLKCYRAYVLKCLILRKRIFKITFKGKYIHKPLERLLDWCYYVGDMVERFILVYIKKPKEEELNSVTSYLFHNKVTKPIHVKVSYCPNEFMLEKILNENGLKITKEHLTSLITEYEVTKI